MKILCDFFFADFSKWEFFGNFEFSKKKRWIFEYFCGNLRKIKIRKIRGKIDFSNLKKSFFFLLGNYKHFFGFWLARFAWMEILKENFSWFFTDFPRKFKLEEEIGKIKIFIFFYITRDFPRKMRGFSKKIWGKKIGWICMVFPRSFSNFEKFQWIFFEKQFNFRNSKINRKFRKITIFSKKIINYFDFRKFWKYGIFRTSDQFIHDFRKYSKLSGFRKTH